MKAWDVIGYAYEADIHCVSCTKKRFPNVEDNDRLEDSEGNPIHPIFASDEGSDSEVCGDCGGSLEEKHEE